MEKQARDKTIEMDDLANAMRDRETRYRIESSQSGRNDRLQQLLLMLRNLSDRDFEVCVESCLAVVERTAKKSVKNESKRRDGDSIKRDAALLLSSPSKAGGLKVS
jgi:hypothetical protein